LLTTIVGNAELALDDVGPAHQAAEPLGQIIQASNSAASLTGQLLAFSRKQILEPRVVDLRALVRGMRSMLIRVIGEDVALRLVESGTDARARVDPGLVEQAVMNLAANARDAMPDGGTLTIETGVVSVREGDPPPHAALSPRDYVRLSVSDTGQGMTKEVMVHLFEPFFTTKPKGHGTGLGLATTYGAVRQSGGHIDVSSDEGRGSTFTIYLPRTGEAATATAEAAAPTSGGTETVLVVEDDDGVRELARRALARLGYTVLTAPAGEPALALARAHDGTIHLLVTDVVMPGMNGREVADHLRALRPETRVLFTSGYTENVIVHRGVLEDGLAFLAKPYSPQALGEKVRQILDRA
jgi:CheY-like chemotaxis protein